MYDKAAPRIKLFGRFVFLLSLCSCFLFPPVSLSGQGANEESDTVLQNSSSNFSGVIGSGARAMGMGGAFIAVADDATAASWNPAGLGQLERPALSLVSRAHFYRGSDPASKYYLPEGVPEIDSPVEYFEGAVNLISQSYGFEFFSLTYPFRIGRLKLVPQLSYQRSISFNMENNTNEIVFEEKIYDEETGTVLTGQGTRSRKGDFEGGIDNFTFSLGTRLFERVNVGVSLNYWVNGFSTSSIETMRKDIMQDHVPVAKLWATEDDYEKAALRGFSINAGILVELSPKLRIGAVYKSATTLDVEYTMEEKNQTFVEIGDQLLDRSPADEAQTDDLSLDWPRSWGVGIAYRPIDALTLSLDFTESQWSTAILNGLTEDDGTEYSAYFPSFIKVVEAPEPGEGGEPGTAEKSHAHGQKDTHQVRLGAEYVFFAKKALIPVRAGLFLDTQYFPDASGETVIFTGATFGLGYQKGIFAFDLALLYASGHFLKTNESYGPSRITEIKVYSSLIIRL